MDPENPRKLLGCATRRNIIAAYHRLPADAHTRLEDINDKVQFP